MTATDSMLDRIALAICKSRYGRSNVSVGDMVDARAALEAMRKPTEAMKDAAHEAMGSGVSRPRRFSSGMAGVVWEAMVREALSGDPTSGEGR